MLKNYAKFHNLIFNNIKVLIKKITILYSSGFLLDQKLIMYIM